MAKTESLTLDDEELETILAIGCNEQSGRVTNYELKELVRVYRDALRAANSDGGVEPAAYFYRNNAGAEVLSRTVLPAMALAVIPYKEHPLYIHPPAKALAGIAVTDEMVERAARSIAENHWSVDSDFIKAVHVSRTWEYHADDARAALAAALK